jgi:hypothetical protein
MAPSKPNAAPLSATLPGTWQLLSRIDVTASGERCAEPSLGEDPYALLFYDRSGNFAAQFMRRDRSVEVPDGPGGAKNNSRAQGGYRARMSGSSSRAPWTLRATHWSSSSTPMQPMERQ